MNSLTKVEAEQFTRSCSVREGEELEHEIQCYSDRYDIPVEELEKLVKNNRDTTPQD